MVNERGIPKRFTCATKETCQFKQHYVNNRCFADYAIRQSCPSIKRADGLSQRQGSKIEEIKVS